MHDAKWGKNATGIIRGILADCVAAREELDRALTLIIGTFHATCARYLRRYGRMIDIPNNFAIADADDWSARL